MKQICRDPKITPSPNPLENFVPSRGRDLAALAATGATGIQPPGKALPSIILGHHTLPSEHVNAALIANPIAALLNVALPPGVKRCCQRIVADPSGVVAARQHALSTLEAIVPSVAHLRERWASCLPAGSPARRLNLPVLHMLARVGGYPDTSVVDDIARGMPIAGTIPPSAALQPRDRPAATTVPQWRAGIPTRNAETINRVEKFRTTELGALCWGKTLREIKSGWLSDPVPLNDDMAASVQLTPRFAVFEQHGDGPRKVRVIDDFKASGVNSTLSMSDTSIPDGLDVFLSLVIYYQSISPGCDLRAGSVDFKHAYKNIGISNDQSEYTAVLLGPPSGGLLVSHLRTQPFGSARAPANWGRVTALLKWILAEFFGISLPIFVDDCFLVETAETVKGAFECVTKVIQLLGFDLDPEKAAVPSKTIKLLGASISINPEGLTASLPQSRADELIAMILEIIQSNSLSPGLAAKLRGKLGYAQSLMFGRYGRVLLQPITNRQYSRSLKNSHPLNTELSEVLPWWVETIRNAIPRTIPSARQRPIVAYSDAAGCGHIGVVIYVDGIQRTFSSHLPEWFTREETGILEFEMCGAFYALCIAATFDPKRTIILCCDNEGVNGSLKRGACKTVFARALCSAFWNMAASNGTHVWIEHVKGPLNPADPPSRDCTLCNKPFNAKNKRCEIPSSLFRTLSSSANLIDAQLRVVAGSNEYIKAWPCPSQQAEPQ